MKSLNAPYPYYDNPEISDIKDLVELYKDSKKTAFMFRDNGKVVKKTYAEVYVDVMALTGYFFNKYKNKHIAIIGENSYAWIVVALAIMLSGNICVAIDKDADEETARRQLKQADANAVYYSLNYCEQAAKYIRNAYPLEELDDYIREGKKVRGKTKIKQDCEADAMIFFTSGTTGFSKAVVLSQKNIAADIYGAAALFMPGGKVISFLPYHHAFGFVTSALSPYYYHNRVFISGSLKHLLEDFKTAEPDTVFAVPMVVETLYRQIWRQARRQKSDKKLLFGIRFSRGMQKIGIDWRKKLFDSVLKEFGGNLQFIVCGGAHLDVKYIEWFRSIGIEVLNGYGITECSPVVSVNRNFWHRDGSIGQACRGVNVKIIDDEIVVSGDVVMKGYYKDKKATAEVLRHGNLYTGDLGRIDEDGFIYVTGRKKNLIILSNGENVCPEEIEAALARDDGVAEVAVYEYGNRIVASIYPNDAYFGDEDYFDDIIYKYNKDKARNRQIAMVRLRSNPMPRNNNGKILRNKLIEEDNNEE